MLFSFFDVLTRAYLSLFIYTSNGTGRNRPSCSLASRGSLFRGGVEKKLAHLAGHVAGDGPLLRPCKCLIQIGGFQYPESAHVLLGLGVRSVGDEHPAVGLLPQRLRFGGGGNAASELPGAGSNQFAVETIPGRGGFRPR